MLLADICSDYAVRPPCEEGVAYGQTRPMILSYEKQFCFIHIGKTAGTNVARALEPFAHRPEVTTPAKWLDRVGIHANYLGPHSWRRFRIHATAATVRRNLPADIWDNLFTFAFVRNPYAWLVSQYRFMLRETRHHRHNTVKELGSFNAYVAWEANRKRRSQHSFVCDRAGNVIVDYIGRFESISDDYRHVCDRIGIDAPIPGGNERNSSDFRDAYDAETLQLAEPLIGQDARLFRYGLDGPDCSTSELNALLPRQSATRAG